MSALLRWKHDQQQELVCLAHHLDGMTGWAWAWAESKGLPLDDRNLLMEGSSNHERVLAIGRMANRIAGFEGMQTVMRIAFRDAFTDAAPFGALQSGKNRNRDTFAVTELNSVWHGIGEWMQ